MTDTEALKLIYELKALVKMDSLPNTKRIEEIRKSLDGNGYTLKKKILIYEHYPSELREFLNDYLEN